MAQLIVARKRWLLGFLLLMAAVVIGGAAAVRADHHTQRFIVSVDNVSAFAFTDSGVFNTPTGASSPGPALPGHAYEWTFYAHPGDRLSFATMLVQTNDYFFAPDELGIPLYRANGAPMSGDVTAYVKLWDAGTEGDEALGSGPNQAPRQSGPNTGPDDPNDEVRQVLTDDLPPVEDLVQVTLASLGNGRFRLRIANVSGSSSFPGPLAPGVGVVHSSPAPLFLNGEADWGAGLEALAEDGNAAPLGSYLAGHTGVNTPLAPVAWVVHEQANALFTPGASASSGLEALAEDGGPMKLVASLPHENKGAAAVGRGASGPGPIGPGGNYTFEITAAPGYHLSLATMFVQSNDWFYALTNQPLFTDAGDPISGNFTHMVHLYDAGTEVDQTPGFGSNQAPRQAGPNTGPNEGGVVQPVTADGFTTPSQVIHLTITPVD